MEMALNIDVILAVLAAVAVIVFVVFRVRDKFKPVDPKDIVVTVHDVDVVYNAVRDSAGEDVFAVFLIPSIQTSANDGVPSVELALLNGVVGIDYVLLSKANIEKQQSFVDLANEMGHTVVEHVLGDVPYLRVEDGDVPQLMRETLRRIFDLNDDELMSIVLEGIDHSNIVPRLSKMRT
ncbi:MAG: hypothetical protein H7X70_01075 [Candidatus Kapabacteria bacterium]|nr:hypothetical protein [Candidatus Kapabacteria bacterium]